MLIDIPNELVPYVRMSKKQGLVAMDSIPQELMPLYEEVRVKVLKIKQERDGELSAKLTHTSDH